MAHPPQRVPTRPPMRTQRNFRWVAHAPARRTVRPPAARRTPTPSYREVPRWGLTDVPRTEYVPPPTAATSVSAMAPTLLLWSAGVFVLAAIAEIGRYVVLLVNRHTLIQPVVLGISDAAELCLSVLSFLMGIVTTVSCALWLRDARSAAYRSVGRADPRRPRTLLLGTLVPVMNFVMPGVFLTEMDRTAPRYGVASAIRWWWIAWIGNWVLLGLLVLWRRQDGVQALANGVVFSAVQYLVAAALAVTTLLVVRRSSDRELLGRPRELTRWVVVTPDDAGRKESVG